MNNVRSRIFNCSNVRFYEIFRSLKVVFWPNFPLAGHINKRYSGCIGRQVTGPFLSYSRALYKRSVKEQNRPKVTVRRKLLNVLNVL